MFAANFSASIRACRLIFLQPEAAGRAHEPHHERCRFIGHAISFGLTDLLYQTILAVMFAGSR